VSEHVAHASIICIVDDDAEVRASLRSFLRSAGLDARTFDGAAAFLASSDCEETDCVITDVHMPGLDGLALTRAIIGMRRDCPVIVMTAFPTPSIQAEAETSGATAFLAKPVDPDLLLHKVEAALG
jgi:FixJ family two-component response regulator